MAGWCILRTKTFLYLIPQIYKYTVPAVPVITDFKLANKPLLIDSLMKLEKIKLAFKALPS
jgi:hypothetical protein